MYVCDVCGKGVLRGNLVSHAKNRTKRIYMPNLHAVKTLINGNVESIRACTKCLRRVVKAPKRDLSKVIKKAAVVEVKPVEVKEVKKSPPTPPLSLKLQRARRLRKGKVDSSSKDR